MQLMVHEFQDRIRDAAARHLPLAIVGQGSKRFYGEAPRGEPLDTRAFSGVSSYEPTELVVTAKAGTPIAELEAALAAQGQCLAFEPPRFGGQGTVGGMVASGLSGPSRASCGAVRDHVLGLSLLNGRAELLNFGGTVMKNVAGYDVSRLMAGAMGVLGLILEVSLKVVPLPVCQATLRFEMTQAQALQALNRWGGLALPLHASAHSAGVLSLRLAGAQAAVRAAVQFLGGEAMSESEASQFWAGLRDHDHAFFKSPMQDGAALWRLSVPSTAPELKLAGEQLVEWGGAQRWLLTSQSTDANAVRQAASAAGGHATLFRAQEKRGPVFTPLSAPLQRIHQQLKQAFDPAGIFNPGRLYPEF
ncbi:MAG: glycolate oxidase subunit GlcE [Burkholderiaceae bacterium]|nr:glycolate oxidase subunit GlcE [Roseateles sp.]MBV8471203.1 glycolate oxidase subunit GlcE [Burkholderiaceae bacterium]